MKTRTIAFSAASVLVISLIIIGTFKTGIVSALTAATTTDATSTASDTTTASSTPATDATSTSATPPAQTQTPDQSQAQTQPNSSKPTLKLVHVVRTKYIDYFTDGTEDVLLPRQPEYR